MDTVIVLERPGAGLYIAYVIRRRQSRSPGVLQMFSLTVGDVIDIDPDRVLGHFGKGHNLMVANCIGGEHNYAKIRAADRL